jgi:hypothetical protein
VDSYEELGAQAADACCAGAVIIGGATVDPSVTGEYVVTYDAMDCNGNAAAQITRTAHVIDSLDPVLFGCPGDIEVNAATGAPSAAADWEPPTADDVGSGVVSLTCTHTPGQLFPVGKTTVSYTATDASGNSVSCSFEVVVHETFDLVEIPETLRFLDRDWPEAAGGGGGLEDPPVIGELSLATIYEVGEPIAGCCLVIDFDGDPVDVPEVTLSFYQVVPDEEPPDLRIPLSAQLLHADPETLRYCFSIPTNGLEAGYYDIRLGVPFMDHEWIRVELIPPVE